MSKKELIDYIEKVINKCKEDRLIAMYNKDVVLQHYYHSKISGMKEIHDLILTMEE